MFNRLLKHVTVRTAVKRGSGLCVSAKGVRKDTKFVAPFFTGYVFPDVVKLHLC